MTPNSDPDVVHWINLIWVVDQDGAIVALRQLSPDEPAPASLAFTLPPGTTQVTAYEYCNQHGLFRGDTLSVSASQTTADAPAAGSAAAYELRSCGADCDSVWANINFMHQQEFFTAEPHYDDEKKKHMPFLMLEKGGATLTVGLGSITGDP